MNRRQFIVGSSLLGAFGASAGEKTTDGGLADVDWAVRRQKARPVVPPGAHGERHFAARCVGCGLCLAACPAKCLRPSMDLSRLGRVELDFRHGWCRPGCNLCATVCPTGAIERIRLPAVGQPPQGAVGRVTQSAVGQVTQSAVGRVTQGAAGQVTQGAVGRVHIGYAVWQRATCIRVTEGVDCHACEKHCPVRAVKLIAGVPVVDRTACIGCGACEHYCPARPLTAIHVEGCEQHREYAPMSQDDLLDEMARRVEDGHAAVIARDGVIVMTLEGRGLGPIEEALLADEAAFDGVVAADKVVGIRAADIYVRGRAKVVYGRVMSEGGKARLEKAGITARFGTLVPRLDCEAAERRGAGI